MIHVAALPLILALSQGAPAPKVAVTDVVADRRTVRAGGAEQAAWTFRTTAPAKVGAWLYDARDLLVRTLRAPSSLPAGGQHRLTWDGSDDEGRRAPPGYYLLVIGLESAGETIRWDPSASTGGSLATSSVLGYDPGTGMIRYALQNPSLVRIHIGLKGDGPLMRTLVDWVARGAGEQTELWDGRDNSGVVSFGDSRDLDIQVWAYDLPVNAVVVESPGEEARHRAPAGAAAPGEVPPERMGFLEFPAGRARRPDAGERRHEIYNHWLHSRDRCRNPGATLEPAAGSRRLEDGAADLSSPVSLRLRVPEEDAAFLQDERFEVVVYLDGTFVFEEEQGYLPFTWTLRPEMVTTGDHVVTFMIRGYEGHFGSTSIRVRRAAVSAAGRR